MKPILITQRVDENVDYRERRDGLDQRWARLLFECGLIPIVAPNNLDVVRAQLDRIEIDGILLTGGNSLSGDDNRAPERDEVERTLLIHGLDRDLPIFGVCRGMQVIQDYFGSTFQRVKGHVAHRQEITVDGEPRVVNSFHDWGTFETVPELDVWALSGDGVVKAVRHVTKPMLGIMWHPERLEPFQEKDIILLKEHFGADR